MASKKAAKKVAAKAVPAKRGHKPVTTKVKAPVYITGEQFQSAVDGIKTVVETIKRIERNTLPPIDAEYADVDVSAGTSNPNHARYPTATVSSQHVVRYSNLPTSPSTNAPLEEMIRRVRNRSQEVLALATTVRYGVYGEPVPASTCTGSAQVEAMGVNKDRCAQAMDYLDELWRQLSQIQDYIISV